MREIGSISGPVPVRCEEGNVLIQSRQTWDQNGFDWQGNGFESFKRGFGAEKGKGAAGPFMAGVELAETVVRDKYVRTVTSMQTSLTFATISGNYWLGLERLHVLTSGGHGGQGLGHGHTWELLVELWTEGEDRPLTLAYSNFSVGDAESGFRLSLGCAENGNLSDSLGGQKGARFVISGGGGGGEHIGANDILTSDRQPCDNGIRVSESPNKLIFFSPDYFPADTKFWLRTFSRFYLGLSWAH